jgi:adenylate cyclase
MEAPPLERRLVAILAADVEGYSRLTHRDEETTMATLSARRALVDELIARHRGRIREHRWG